MEGGSKGGNGEVRRVNVVYFLSRLGHVEHPHLIRVHHHTRSGVFLRDVKRWLVDLRGSEMPEAFSWSYKRRYKNGYVWQDLLDDDLITPISDNEYVLKGSEILHSSSKDEKRVPPYEQKKAWASRNGSEIEEKRHSISTDSSGKSSSEIYKEWPVFGSRRSTATTTTDESTMTNDEDASVSKNQNPRKPDDFQHLGKNKISNGEDKIRDGGSGSNSGRPSVSSTSSKSSTYTRSKSHSSGASQMFRNLITCGGLDADDAVLMPLSRSARTSSASLEDETRHQYQHQHNARKSFDGAWNGLKMKEKIEFCRPKLASSKPGMGPFCSQCGKSFKPEKMHSHMNQCRGMKNSTKNAAISDQKTPSQRQGNSPENLSARQCLLAARSLKE